MPEAHDRRPRTVDALDAAVARIAGFALDNLDPRFGCARCNGYRRPGAPGDRRTGGHPAASAATMSAALPGRALANPVPAHRFVPFGSSTSTAALRIGAVIWLISG